MDTPDDPQDMVEIVDSGPETGPGNSCHACIEEGLALRLTWLRLDEPAEPPTFCDFMNGAYGAPDIEVHQINIVFIVDEVEQADDGSLHLKMTCGPAWHDGSNPPGGYFLLEGMTDSVEARIDSDCHFSTTGPFVLALYSGPTDHPRICSAGDLNPQYHANSIRLSNVLLEGKLTSDCEHLELKNGRIQWCIGLDSACRVCLWGTAPIYEGMYTDPDPDIVPKPCDPSYCQRWCGPTGWISFGGFLAAIEVPFGCDMDGDDEPDSYYMGGDWTGKKIDMKE